MSRQDAYKTILITGASSGLGEALAFGYAKPGATLALIGRHAGRLGSVADRCIAQGAEVLTACIDVTNGAVLRQWIGEFDRVQPLDLVIANAGVASTQGASLPGESWEDIRRVFDINVYGALATIHPAMEGMRARRRGQIALMSSLGGYLGMPISPAYNASKAAIRVYGEGLRGWLAAEGVGVSVISPGFVRTQMSAAYPGPTPFMVSAEKAALIIQAGLARNRAHIAFPRTLALLMAGLAVLPTDMSLALQRLFRF